MNYFSKDQILVLNSKTFFSNPHDTLMEVFNFVGVNPNFKVKNLKPKNIGRKKESVSNEVYNYLNDYFKSHNEALDRKKSKLNISELILPINSPGFSILILLTRRA